MKRTLALILTLAMILSCGATALAAEPAVVASPQTVTVDGEQVSVTAYNIDDYNYFRLRDMAIMLNGTDSQFEVAYDEASSLITVTTFTAYSGKTELVKGEDLSSTCVESSQTISVDGQAVTLKAYNIGGYNYFKLRDLANELGFAVDFKDNTAVVESVEPLSFEKATVTKLTPKVDGKPLNVTKYEAVYCATPNRIADQQLALFIPENATANSPIVYMVDNSGWRSDAYSKVAAKVADGGEYVSGANDPVGECLANGYVVMVAGARSRADGLTGDEYLGHAATMTDAKAAIRWVKANADKLPAGNADRIVITGTSGGGALSVVISASGNSADYYESLYEIGAAGIAKNADGTYTDTLSDDIWGTIAYCPITDLPNACAAYEWTWADARLQLIEDGVVVQGKKGPTSYTEAYGMGAELMADATTLLTANYVEYINSLGLESVSAENLKATIIAHMEAEIAESIKEIGVEQMVKDLGGAEWLVIKDDGTFEYDYEEHLYWVGTQSVFKAPSAFSNVGMSAWKGNMNEDDLFGRTSDAYSPFNEYSWNNDDTENAVGKDDTGLTWEEWLATEDGKAQLNQMKRTSPIEYLLSDEGDSAPNWYVRYGMADRDSSFAVEAVLNAAMEADETITNKTFEFAWLKGHSGNYDVQEAYAWLKEALDADTDHFTIADAEVTTLNITLDGVATTVTQYVDTYYAHPQSTDQIVTLYVPENATEDSPIIYMVNNGGWFMNQADKAYKVKNGDALSSTSDTDVVGRAFSEGYIVMSAGSRNRMMPEIGHSPATMTDYKAAIRWLRYNAEALGVGNTDIIVATGTSGGGALSTVLAASGDSSDYFESLCQAGAAGIAKNEDGTYTSTISDAIWGVIAYCPITDLGNACEAYEWQYMSTREAMYESGHMDYGTVTEEMNMAASAELKADYEEYLASLGIEAVAPENMEATIIALMEAEIAESIKEIGVEQMKADLAATEYAGTWLTINEDGTFEYDYEEHLYWLARKQTLKPASAFSNVGMTAWAGQMNEDNLFGDPTDVYCPFGDYSWMNDNTENAVGYDDTGLTWAEFLATEKGQMVQLQMRMTSAVSYLLDEGDATVAPYWYVRHGMADRDTAFAVEALLYNTMLNNEHIDQDVASFEFAWLKPHSGDYDVQEAYNWLEKALLEDLGIEFWDVNNDANIDTDEYTVTLDGESLGVTYYNGHYYDWDEENTLTVGPGKYGPSGDRDDCQISIYVPETATKDSAVMFLIENGSWAQSGFKEVIADGQAFDSTGSDRVALALANDMIVVSYGARCRGSVDKETGKIAIHAPTMIADTKAAIRFVKYNINEGNIPGDADKVIISGHSGGGALTAIIAASGNSSDFDEYLVNAAPATDDVLATMSSAPITDLAMADQAYEWTFGDYRAEAPYESLSYGEYGEDMIALSEELAADYVTYVADMFGLTEEEYVAKIEAYMEASVQHEIDLGSDLQYAGSDGVDLRPADDERGWFELDEDGNVVAGSWDLEAYTTWLINNAGINKTRYSGNELKGIMAFNSEGMKNGYMRNENNLWGTPEQAYSIAYEELWTLVKDPAAIGVDKYASFDEFWAAEGELVGKQMKSVSVMPYLMGTDAMWYLDGVETSEECDVAPYWFVRHGFADADTSYAVVASLFLAVEEAAEETNLAFGWERNHNGGGNTYYQEFFQWLAEEGII